ncbi:Hypothetical predicted protein [Octopus vulgaris]|uniref:Uncharacterized protein n=1 Tax=Octopus vulgaris TaxID=6645 RepID=A0AA36EYX2_OCTVU|nr:Hypothetical predicted protein [Octopus vulgaris]
MHYNKLEKHGVTPETNCHKRCNFGDYDMIVNWFSSQPENSKNYLKKTKKKQNEKFQLRQALFKNQRTFE